MKISLKPASGKGFVFSILPEQIQVKYGAKYQSFDILSKGTVKVPKGTDVAEISWNGEFFGATKKKEAIVRTSAWQSPNSCVKTLKSWMNKGTELTLIVSGTWLNIDVTIASFEATPYGAYGNVKYSIVFSKVKELKIRTTKESKLGKKKKTNSRSKKKNDSSVSVVVKGDTLIKIAKKKGCKWQDIYNKNKTVIEKVARQRGRKDSDHGHWIYPGTKLKIPGGQLATAELKEYGMATAELMEYGTAIGQGKQYR